jgi:hypothetical protein
MMTVLYALALIAVLALLALVFGAMTAWLRRGPTLTQRVDYAVTGRCVSCRAARLPDDLAYVRGLGYVCADGCDGGRAA